MQQTVYVNHSVGRQLLERKADLLLQQDRTNQYLLAELLLRINSCLDGDLSKVQTWKRDEQSDEKINKDVLKNQLEKKLDTLSQRQRTFELTLENVFTFLI